MPTDFNALISRLEAASGPDREIDAALAVASGWLTPVTESNGAHGCLRGYADPSGEAHWFAAPWWPSEATNAFPPSDAEIVRRIHSLPRFTASLDAITALIARALLGCAVELRWGSCNAAGEMFLPSARLFVCIGEQEFGWTWKHAADAKAPTPALALCLALVRAKAAMITPL